MFIFFSEQYFIFWGTTSVIQLSNFIIGWMGSKQEKQLVLSHTSISDEPEWVLSPDAVILPCIQQVSAEHLQAPSTVPGLWGPMVDEPWWAWGCQSFIWALSLRSKLVSVTFISGYSQSRVWLSTVTLGMALMAQDSEKAPWGCFGDGSRQAWLQVLTCWCGATPGCPSLKGVKQLCRGTLILSCQRNA